MNYVDFTKNPIPQEIIPIKNVTSVTQYTNLLNYLLSESVNWHYIQNVHLVGDHSTESSDTHGFVLTLLRDGIISSSDYDKVLPILFAIVDKLKRELISITRVSALLSLNVNKSHPHFPHTDVPTELFKHNHYTAIYYLGDSDGDTVFFNADAKTIVHTQKFEKNTAVVFNSSILHSACLPLMHKERLVLNFNFELN